MDHPFLAEVVPRTEGCKLDTGMTLLSECLLLVFLCYLCFKKYAPRTVEACIWSVEELSLDFHCTTLRN